MNELLLHNGTPTVSSRDIAEKLGKRHDNIIRDIEKILQDEYNSNLRATQNTAKIDDLIIKSEYIASNGKKNKQYLLTKDGFTLFMFNIQGYNDVKLEYINKFNAMEQFIKEQQKQLSQGIDTKIVMELVGMVAENQKTIIKLLNKEPLTENKEIEKIAIKFYSTQDIAKKYGYGARLTHKALVNRGVLVEMKNGFKFADNYKQYGKVVKISEFYYPKWNEKGKDFLNGLFERH